MEKRTDRGIKPCLFIELDLVLSNGQIYIGDDCKDLAAALGYEKDEISGVDFARIVGEGKLRDAYYLLRQQMMSLNSETEGMIALKCKDESIKNFFTYGRMVGEGEGGVSFSLVLVNAPKTARYIQKINDQLQMFSEKLEQTESIVNRLQITNEQDSLTHILNAGTTRRLSEEYLSQGDKCCAIMVIDVDNFKRINDRYGHMVGDEVMIKAAATLKKLFRSNDIVGRIGGDEFLVLMKDVEDLSIIRGRLEKIVVAFNEMKFESMKDEIMSCSVGASISPVHANAYNSLFLLADKAMYRAKSLGGNRYMIEEAKK